MDNIQLTPDNSADTPRVKAALEKYRAGHYLDALELYQQASRIHGERLFYANVAVTAKRLSPPQKKRSLAVTSNKKTARDIESIRSSSLFDANWYLRQYPDVGWLGLDPAEHYYRYGRMLNRDPSPAFCTRFYIDTHPDISQVAINPLVHQIQQRGRRDDIQPHPRYVLFASHNVAQAGQQDRAIALAESYLPQHLAYTIELLRANAALARGTEADWLAHLNRFLRSFDLTPVALSNQGTKLDRLTTAPLSPVTGGPRVTVIMPVWNAKETVRAAARSILAQTWRNLELIIVDDASDDGTWPIVQEIARRDDRVKLRRNRINAGPYVSKNLALLDATGDWITGHDADDWAHPQRLELHLARARAQNLTVSLTHMIRMRPDGRFCHFTPITTFSFDGVSRKASISCLFTRALLSKHLGFWDTVRFGADSEMIARAEALLGAQFTTIRQIGMICLDHAASLTNHAKFGVNTVAGFSPHRAAYRDAWSAWHRDRMTPRNAYLAFPQKRRRYKAAEEMVVTNDCIRQLLYQ
jgi:hypothetical protein